MSRRKIGRNERCPCGSGEKYKRCCLRRLEAAAPAPPAPVAPDVDDVLGHIERLHALLEEGGPLAGLRFDEVAFAAAVDEHGEDALQAFSDDQAQWEILMERCAPQLMDRAWLQRARRTLLRLEGSGCLAPEDVAAVQFARRAVPRRPSREPYPSPLEMAVFPIQLDELGRRNSELHALVSELAKVVPELLDPAAMREVSPDLWSRAQRLVASDPGLRATLEADVDEAVDRAIALLNGADAPELLRFEDHLRLWSVMQPATGPDDLLARLRAFVDEDANLKHALAARCADGLREASTAEEKRRWADLAIAVQTDLDHVVVCVLKNDLRVSVADDEEERLIEACTKEAASYEPWLAWLGASRGPEVAARAREDVRLLTS